MRERGNPAVLRICAKLRHWLTLWCHESGLGGAWNCANLKLLISRSQLLGGYLRFGEVELDDVLQDLS
jgi:hypothetical protein